MRGDLTPVLTDVSSAARFHLYRDGVLVLSSEEAVAAGLGMVAGPPPPAVLARTVWDPPVPGFVRRARSFPRGSEAEAIEGKEHRRNSLPHRAVAPGPRASGGGRFPRERV